jgi:hypothetical protein
MIGILLTALGNRGWGAAEVPNWIAVILMGMGVWIANQTPLWTLPLFILSMWVFRFRSPRPWLNMAHTPDYLAGVIRGLWIIPHTLLVMWLTTSWISGIIGGIVVLAIPLTYYMAYKIWPNATTTPNKACSIAELATGAYLALI